MADLGALDSVIIIGETIIGGADFVPTHAHIVRYETLLDSVVTQLVVVLRDRRTGEYLASKKSILSGEKALAVFTRLPDTGLEGHHIRGIVVAPNSTRNSAIADWIAAVTV